MVIFKRLLIIFSTLAITSFASDQADRKQIMTPESKPFYEAGVSLYEQGCGKLVHEGLVADSKTCAAAIARLTEAVNLNQTLIEANVMLAEVYHYQPRQMNWEALPEKEQKKIFNLGYKHTLKAIEYAPTHPKAKKLFLSYLEKQRNITSK